MREIYIGGQLVDCTLKLAAKGYWIHFPVKVLTNYTFVCLPNTENPMNLHCKPKGSYIRAHL